MRIATGPFYILYDISRKSNKLYRKKNFVNRTMSVYHETFLNICNIVIVKYISNSIFLYNCKNFLHHNYVSMGGGGGGEGEGQEEHLVVWFIGQRMWPSNAQERMSISPASYLMPAITMAASYRVKKRNSQDKIRKFSGIYHSVTISWACPFKIVQFTYYNF